MKIVSISSESQKVESGIDVMLALEEVLDEGEDWPFEADISRAKLLMVPSIESSRVESPDTSWTLQHTSATIFQSIFSS